MIFIMSYLFLQIKSSYIFKYSTRVLFFTVSYFPCAFMVFWSIQHHLHYMEKISVFILKCSPVEWHRRKHTSQIWNDDKGDQ